MCGLDLHVYKVHSSTRNTYEELLFAKVLEDNLNHIKEFAGDVRMNKNKYYINLQTMMTAP